jgi:hypothetical protein
MSDTDHSNDSDSMDLEDPDDFDPDDVLPPPDGYRIRRGLMYTNFQYRVDALRFYDRTIAANLFNVAEHLMQIATDFFNFAVAALAAAQHGLTPVNEAMKNVAIIAAGVAAFFRNESILYYYDFMDLVYYPLLNRGPPPEHERFHPKVHTTIDEFSDDNCYYFTGFNKERVRRLKRALRLHDEIVVVGRRTRFDGEELLLYFLYYLRKKDATFIEMATVGKFGGDPRRFTYAIRAIIAHLHSTFYHKISGDSMRQWTSPQQVLSFRGIEEPADNSITNNPRVDSTTLSHTAIRVKNPTIFITPIENIFKCASLVQPCWITKPTRALGGKNHHDFVLKLVHNLIS